MARSSYIYVVSTLIPGPPRAAFTVRHELVAWLGRQVAPADYLTVYRIPDGLHGGEFAVEMKISDLLDFTAPKYVK